MKQNLTHVKVTSELKQTVSAAESTQWSAKETVLGTALLLAEGASVFGTLILTRIF